MNMPSITARRSASLATVFAAALLALPAAAGDTLLGKIEFPNSGAAEAQDAFLEGMLYMHNFEYDEAAAAFKRAQEIDPDFAMAYWGEAMAYHHPLWNQQARDDGRDVLRKLGRTQEERLAKAGTEREKDWLIAAETLYGMTDASRGLPKPQRDALYSEMLGRMHEKYPDDHEIATLYGLSILGVASENRNTAEYMRAAAELTEVWDTNRMHPGAAHYLIHSYDDPVHAPLGLPMARAYSKIAPAAAHAQHMTSHIFVALGMWDDLVGANETAVEIEFQTLDDANERPLTASHYVYWLEYGYLQQGRFDEAEKLLKSTHERLGNNATSSERGYYGTMFARYILDTRDWDAIDKWRAPEGVAIPSPNYHFTLALDAIRRGDLDAARHHAEYVKSAEGMRPETGANDETVVVLQKELEALFAHAAGDNDAAVALAREAVDLETGSPFQFGPPRIVKPAAELLGDLLLDLGRAEEAVAAYKDQSSRTPRRTATLLGLARAYNAVNDSTRASDAYRELAEVWHTADRGVPGLREALDGAS